jgi:hypothetical protein
MAMVDLNDLILGTLPEHVVVASLKQRTRLSYGLFTNDFSISQKTDHVLGKMLQSTGD